MSEPFLDREFIDYNEQRIAELTRTIAELMQTASLRDQFAMAALNGMMGTSEKAWSTIDEVAKAAYVMADAMMKARKP
jgi:hypothetical protein